MKPASLPAAGTAAAAAPALVARAQTARAAADAACSAELRCGCGSLLARRVPAGVELKCRRCKRTVVLPLADG